MFAALVEPALEDFDRFWEQMEGEEYANVPRAGRESEWENSSDVRRIMEFLYDRFDAFKLILCKSAGTRFEDFAHEVAVREERSSLQFVDFVRAQGASVKEIPPRELHLIVTSYVDSIFQAIEHDFSRDEALHYADTLNAFYLSGWRSYVGLGSSIPHNRN